VTPTRRLPAWIALLLGALGLTALYAEPLRTRLLNDDYLFLEEARSRPLAESLARPTALSNYYRPLSRQIYFEALSHVAGAHPLVFHAINYALFLASVALLADLALALLGPAAALGGCLYFALLPMHRVNLTWVSCSQDLMALAAGLATVALFRRGRRGLALVTYVAALASKESALPVPVALAAWTAWAEGKGWKPALRAVWPFAVAAIAWMLLARAIVVSHGAPAFLHFDPGQFVAAYVHLAQSLLGLETIEGLLPSLLGHPPPIAPLLLLAPLAFWYEAFARGRPAEAARGAATSAVTATGAHATRLVLGLAVVWLAAFGFVTGPVAHTWSAYYYTLAAVGGALIAGLLLRHGDRWTWLILLTSLLWLHAGSTGVQAFARADRPWGWTSHLTSFYFQRGAMLCDAMSASLKALAPAPPRGSRFFFATLPPWAGFQMGNGALIRELYRDPTLDSYFYTAFSETTAADRPARFVYWDGAELRDLYPNPRDAFFQAGSDLLLLDRPAGAAHAFRRGLAAGGDRMDHLYWLGWAELWAGDRARAEATWKQFGAVDDSLFWSAHLRAAHNRLGAGDTLDARRHLIRAIEFGMGRPEAHAVLGELLLEERPKYATLELKVASWLKPEDWRARRFLTLGLAAARLDDAARRELEALMRVYPEWRNDSVLVDVARVLDRRNTGGATVARF
jgi:hypothetical protein